MKQLINDAIAYIGADDPSLDLFESQYKVPNGVAYNSYVVKGNDKTVIMDTIDSRKTGEWLAKMEEALDGRTPDYLVVSHLEPDHAANIGLLAEKYPDGADGKRTCTQYRTFDQELYPADDGRIHGLGRCDPDAAAAALSLERGRPGLTRELRGNGKMDVSDETKRR